MKSIEAFKKAAREAGPTRHARAEQGSYAIRIEAGRHGVDLQQPEQLQAFMLGVGWLYLASRAGQLDEACEAIGQFFIEESL